MIEYLQQQIADLRKKPQSFERAYERLKANFQSLADAYEALKSKFQEGVTPTVYNEIFISSASLGKRCKIGLMQAASL